MKTSLKLYSFFPLVVVIMAASCNGKSSGSTADSSAKADSLTKPTVPKSDSTGSTIKTDSATTLAAKSNALLDSLAIIDTGERKVFIPYDENISNYLAAMKQLAADPAATKAKRDAIETAYQSATKAIKPKIDSVGKIMNLSPAGTTKYLSLSNYEGQRLTKELSAYERAISKTINKN